MRHPEPWRGGSNCSNFAMSGLTSCTFSDDSLLKQWMHRGYQAQLLYEQRADRIKGETI